MDKRIWPNYETEAAAARNALGITQPPIPASEYLRRNPTPAIQPQRRRALRLRKPLAPTKIENDLDIHAPRWVAPLLIMFFVVGSVLAMTLH